MKVKSVRISPDSEKAAGRIRKSTGLKESDVLRLAIERGLPIVEQGLAIIIGKPAASAK